MIEDYDPDVAPDPEEWLALDDGVAAVLILNFHERARISLPNALLHASIHAVVENQIAEGDKLPAREALERLMAEGLDRHDAVHAIGSVLSEYLCKLFSEDSPPADDSHSEYLDKVRSLTAEQWLSTGDD